MRYFEFDNSVKNIYGENAASEVANVVLELGGRRTLLISDKNLRKLGITSKIIKLLNEKQVAVGAIFIELPVAPNVATIRELYKIYRSNGCDSIVACGGGVAIELAKGLKLLIATRSKNLLDCRGVNNVKVYVNIPFVAIPTNAGGGADVNKISLIKDGKTGRYMDFETTAQLPQVTLLQPNLTCTTPMDVTAKGIVNILAHSIDAYCGLNENPLTQTFCAQAISLVYSSIDSLLKNSENVQARAAMLKAHELSAIGFSGCKSGIMHAISYALAEKYNIHYSLCLCVVIDKCLRFNYAVNKEKYSALSFFALDEDKFVQLSKEERAEEFLKKINATIKGFCKKFNFATTLKGLGIQESDLDDISLRAFTEGSVVTNPQSVTLQDITNILKDCYDTNLPGGNVEKSEEKSAEASEISLNNIAATAKKNKAEKIVKSAGEEKSVKTNGEEKSVKIKVLATAEKAKKSEKTAAFVNVATKAENIKTDEINKNEIKNTEEEVK